MKLLSWTALPSRRALPHHRCVRAGPRSQLHFDPKNVKALSRRAFVLCETGRAEQALEAIAQVPIYPYIGLYLSLPGPLSILI